MQVSIAFLQDPSVTDTLNIVKSISKGKFKVYKAYSPAEEENYALKIFPRNTFGTEQYHKEAIISQLSHPNIISYIPVTAKFDKDNHYHCIVTEYAKYGDACQMILGGILTSETLIRTYFHQIVAGLGYLHSQGVAHLDLKPENLMFGSGFTLKIIDFDQAQRIKDKNITSGGTDGYRAPEVIDGSCMDFEAADIYSLGIVLYTMKARSTPFTEVVTQDANRKKRTALTHYSTFIKDNAEFWEMKAARKKDSKLFSEDLKELINGMLQYDVAKRFTLSQVKRSNWFRGPVLNKEELRAEMKARWQSVKKSKLSNSE